MSTPAPAPAPDAPTLPAPSLNPRDQLRAEIAQAGRALSPSRRRELEREAMLARYGVSPLEFLVRVMVDETRDMDHRIDAAKAAAPFCHPKLSQVEVADERDTVPVEEQRRMLEDKLRSLGIDPDKVRTALAHRARNADAIDVLAAPPAAETHVDPKP